MFMKEAKEKALNQFFNSLASCMGGSTRTAESNQVDSETPRR